MPRPDKNKVSEAFSRMPVVFGSAGRVEINGRREAVVEGCVGVLEYGEDRIRLNMGKGSIVFVGRRLNIRSFERDHAEIEGFFTNIEFA